MEARTRNVTDPVRDAVAYARASSRLDSLGAERILSGYPEPEVLMQLLAAMLGAEIRGTAELTGVTEDERWDRLATTLDWLG
jgi:hypothetical protein